MLEGLDVYRYGSQVTLYNANDGSVFVNTSDSLSAFYSLWDVLRHQQQTSGLNLPSILQQLIAVGGKMLDDEKSRGSVGGQSFIALIVPQMAGVSEADSNFAAEKIVGIHETIPDLTFLFWSAGSHGRFERFVRDKQRDLFPLMAAGTGADSGQQVLGYIQPLLERIQSSKRKPDKLLTKRSCDCTCVSCSVSSTEARHQPAMLIKMAAR